MQNTTTTTTTETTFIDILGWFSDAGIAVEEAFVTPCGVCGIATAA